MTSQSGYLCAWVLDTPLENALGLVLLIVLAGGLFWLADWCIRRGNDR